MKDQKSKKKAHAKLKEELHKRNKHQARYDFKALVATCPELATFVKVNDHGDESVKFSDPEAVLMLNKALLQHHYGVKDWSIPSGFLCPPVPGRADYIHYIADLLASCNGGVIPRGNSIKSLDVGVGANCIYPVIGNAEYRWSFVGADVEPSTIESAKCILDHNPNFKNKIDLRLQKHSYNFFKGIIKDDELFDFTICNPPFHASQEEAEQGTLDKLSSLNKKEVSDVVLNFGGQGKELYCPGGEERFIKNMVAESKLYASSCFWFSTLVSKKENVRPIKVALKKAGAVDVRTVAMSQGTKMSRFIAWTFLSPEQQKDWVTSRWK